VCRTASPLIDKVHRASDLLPTGSSLARASKRPCAWSHRVCRGQGGSEPKRGARGGRGGPLASPWYEARPPRPGAALSGLSAIAGFFLPSARILGPGIALGRSGASPLQQGPFLGEGLRSRLSRKRRCSTAILRLLGRRVRPNTVSKTRARRPPTSISSSNRSPRRVRPRHATLTLRHLQPIISRMTVEHPRSGCGLGGLCGACGEGVGEQGRREG
jgi:hypothetical protein